MSRRTRTTLAIAYFVAATAALIWPIYPAVGNRIEPRVFGLPWSLTHVLLVIAGNAAILVLLYTTRALDPDPGGRADRPEEDRG